MNLRVGLPQALMLSLLAHAALIAPWPGSAPEVASEVVRVQPITVRLTRAHEEITPADQVATERPRQTTPPGDLPPAPEPDRTEPRNAASSPDLVVARVEDAEPLLDFETISTLREMYLQRLHRHASRHIAYPPAARQAGIEGETTVSFRLDADGNVLSARLIQQSAQPLLDDAVIPAIVTAAPWPTPPPGLFAQDSEIELWLPFRLE